MNATAKHIMERWAVAWAPTGSRYICNPPPIDTDEDWVCLSSDGLRKALELAGATVDGDPEKYEGMTNFVSWRLGSVNLILTDCPDFYRLFVAATEEARRQNLMHKPDRIALFQRHLYGNVEFACDEIPL